HGANHHLAVVAWTSGQKYRRRRRVVAGDAGWGGVRVGFHDPTLIRWGPNHPIGGCAQFLADPFFRVGSPIAPAAAGSGLSGSGCDGPGCPVSPASLRASSRRTTRYTPTAMIVKPASTPVHTPTLSPRSSQLAESATMMSQNAKRVTAYRQAQPSLVRANRLAPSSPRKGSSPTMRAPRPSAGMAAR